MLGIALLLAPAWIQAPAARPPLSTRLGLEGPLDNDTDPWRNQVAHDELAAGDAAFAKADDEASRVAAFEHWRQALVVSSPLDCVAVDRASETRLSTSVRAAVTGRLHRGRATAADQRFADDFAQRFEGIAANALAGAGGNEAALERVWHENPFTRSAFLAGLRVCDAALERGATAKARAALNLLGSELPAIDETTKAAIDARSKALPPLTASAPASPVRGAAPKLVLERALDVAPGAGQGVDRMLEPGFAIDSDGRVWIQTGERLIAIARDGTAANFEPQKLVNESPQRGAWLPGFGDVDRAWLQRPAIAGPTLAVVLGRARDTRGNALAAFDIQSGTPRILWMRHDAENTDDAVLPGRLEFQPGPLAIDGLVIAQVLQWVQEGAHPDAQRVDGRNTHAWLVAFDAASGNVAWKRRLASGADRRSRALERLDNARSTSIASPPLEEVHDAGGEDVRPAVVACTELGLVARVSALDGRLLDSYLLKRVRHDPDIRPGSGGPFSRLASRAAVAPADADEFVYVLGDDRHKVFHVPGLERLLGFPVDDLLAVVQVDGRSMLHKVEVSGGARSNSLPFARGAGCTGGEVVNERILVALGGTLALYSMGLTLLSEIELLGLESERHVGVWAGGSRVYVAGEGRIWIVRGE